MYDKEFYDEAYERNLAVANIIMPVILNTLMPKSIVDFGCGRGMFLMEAEKRNIEILGIDGSYLDVGSLCINEKNFRAEDLSKKLSLNRKYDIAMTYEVAEHIAPECADIFIDNLTNASDVVIFSAAVPNQGGVGHTNEQWPSYWVEKFKQRKYKVSNCLRKKFWYSNISPLRRQNILLFVKEDIYEDIVVRFGEQENELVDIVNPDYFVMYVKDVYDTAIRSGVTKMVNVMNKAVDWEKLAFDLSNYTFGELCDNLNLLIEFCNNEKFRNTIKCRSLDIFEQKRCSNRYLIYGGGGIGERVITLLQLLGKEVDFCCDSANMNKMIGGLKVTLPQEAFEKYSNQIIVIASKKNYYEIKTNIAQEYQRNIFEWKGDQ